MKALLIATHRWVATLKFKIVALAVTTGVLSAAATATLVTRGLDGSVKRMVLAEAVADREHSASLLGTKVSMLTDALVAVARHAPTEVWSDGKALEHYLLDQPALGVLFASVYGAAPDGQMLARVEAGQPSAELANIADRTYFRQAMSLDQPVVSEVLLGKVQREPVVVFAVPAIDTQGRHLGVLAATIALRSTGLFADIRTAMRDEAGRDLVIDRGGRVLSHPDPLRVMQAAADEPGLAEMVRAWLASGSPIETSGIAVVQGDYVVSSAGIPLTDWIQVRVKPKELAFAPVHETQAAVWPAAAVAGLLAAVLAGTLGLVMTRPISRLRACAETLLGETASVSNWPTDGGELGDLATAFRVVVEQREQRQTEVNALLLQLEAVLDHADVGIALTRSGRFELVSRQFCQMFRCEKAEAIGQATRMIYASDQAFEALVKQAQPAFTEHGVFDGELELMRRTGQVFWARMRGRAVVPGDVAQGTIWTIEDVTAARQQRERLTYSASHDGLTGLLNRVAFEQLLDAATASATEVSCALFIDLDRFKQVNDTGGHAAGDALLRDVAGILTEHVRKTDVVARLGGDEFAVLLTSCPSRQAHSIASKLCAAVIAHRLTWQGISFSVGASIGMVEIVDGFSSAADVLRAADSACYQAKKRGRSRVELFQPSGRLELDTLSSR